MQEIKRVKHLLELLMVDLQLAHVRHVIVIIKWPCIFTQLKMNDGGQRYTNPMLTFMPFLNVNPYLDLTETIPNLYLNPTLGPEPNLHLSQPLCLSSAG